MTKENSNPPPASQHKKVPEPPELDEVFGKIEILLEEDEPIKAKADYHNLGDFDSGSDPASYSGPYDGSSDTGRLHGSDPPSSSSSYD